MREILFRGKRQRIEDWVEGSLIVYPDGDCYIARPSNNPCVLDKFNIDPATVGQFTGLTDKNGKKIFEGDILDVMHQGVFECRWDGGNFEFGLSNSNESFGIAYVSPNDIFVIGNIHDNPELLGRSEGE